MAGKNKKSKSLQPLHQNITHGIPQPVLPLEKKGISNVWETIERHQNTLKATNAFDDHRKAQSLLG